MMIDLINEDLNQELEVSASVPEIGIQKIKEVLQQNGLTVAEMYEPNAEGDEVALALVEENLFLYLIYSLTESNDYEFYAEVVDEDRLEELIGENEGLLDTES